MTSNSLLLDLIAELQLVGVSELQTGPFLTLELTQELELDGINIDVATQVILDVIPAIIGPEGPEGPPGPPGTDANYVHEQAVASDTWTLVHNLGKYPSVTIVDSAGDECEGNVNHTSTSQCVVSFSAAFSGRAFLN